MENYSITQFGHFLGIEMLGKRRLFEINNIFSNVSISRNGQNYVIWEFIISMKLQKILILTLQAFWKILHVLPSTRSLFLT
jgi:hypothetical protein